MLDNDVWTIAYGPNWDENYAKICDFDQILCATVGVYVSITMGEAVPTKVLLHYAQNAVEYRAQKYIDDYFETTKHHSELIDFG